MEPGESKTTAIVQRLENGRRTDAIRAVVSPLPRLAIAKVPKKQQEERLDLLLPASICWGPRAWNIYLTTLYQFHVSQSLYSSSKDEYLYH